MKQWYKNMGFQRNPLLISPFSRSFRLVDRENEITEVVYRIKASSMLFIQGPHGSGKTTLLVAAIRTFSGRIIYVDCEKLNNELNIEKLLVNKHSFVKGRLLGIKPRCMILMLDNVSAFSRRNTERIKYFFDRDYLSSVVFAGERIDKTNFSQSLRERIGRRIIKLVPFSYEQVYGLVNLLLRDKYPITKTFLKQLYDYSNKNIGRFLTNLDMILEYVYEDGIDLSTINIKRLLSKLSKRAEKDDA